MSERNLSEEKLNEAKIKFRPLFREETIDLSDKRLSQVDVCAVSALLYEMSGNSETGEIEETNGKRIKGINLSRNYLSDKEVGVLLAGLNNCPSVRELDLSYNYLTERGIYNLLLSLSNLNDTLRLEMLNLEGNGEIICVDERFRGNSDRCNEYGKSKGSCYLREIIETNNSLVYLNISGIEFGYEIDQIAKGMKLNSSLKNLILQSCGLNSSDIHNFLKILTENDSECDLEELDLSLNPISDWNYEVFRPLFDNPRFQNLKKLSLCYVQLKFSSTKIFSFFINDALETNSTLEVLSLRGNLWTKEDMKNIESVLTGDRGSGLTSIDLGENIISIEGAKTIMSSIEKNKHIRDINLEDNKFMEEELGTDIYDQIQVHLAANRNEVYIKKKKNLELNDNESTSTSKSSKDKNKRDSPPARYHVRDELEKESSVSRMKGKTVEVPPITEVGGDAMDLGLNFGYELNVISLIDLKRMNSNSVLGLSKHQKFMLASMCPRYFSNAEKKKDDSSTDSTVAATAGTSSSTSSKKKRRKRRFAKKKAALAMMNKAAQAGMTALRKSFIEQQLIKKGLDKVVKLVSFEEQLVNELNRGSERFSSLLPSVFFKKMTRPLEQSIKKKKKNSASDIYGDRLLHPSLSTLEKFGRSVRLINAISWSTLQRLSGLSVAKPLSTSCSNLINDFVAIKKTRYGKGLTLVRGLLEEISIILIMAKPLRSYAEALLLTVCRRRTDLQERMDFYARKDERMEALATRHISKRMEKIHRAQTLKAVLLKAKKNIQSQENTMSSDDVSSKSSGKTNSRAKSNLDKVLHDVKRAQNRKEKKQQDNLSTTKERQSTRASVTQNVNNDEISRLKENSPERIQDFLEGLTEELDILDNMLKLHGYLQFLMAFTDQREMNGQMQNRVSTLISYIPHWFTKLQKDFSCDVLDHILLQIMAEFKDNFACLVDNDTLSKHLDHLQNLSNPKAVAVQKAMKRRRDENGNSVLASSMTRRSAPPSTLRMHEILPHKDGTYPAAFDCIDASESTELLEVLFSCKEEHGMVYQYKLKEKLKETAKRQDQSKFGIRNKLQHLADRAREESISMQAMHAAELSEQIASEI